MTVVRLRPLATCGPAVYATWLFPSDVQRGNEDRFKLPLRSTSFDTLSGLIFLIFYRDDLTSTIATIPTTIS